MNTRDNIQALVDEGSHQVFLCVSPSNLPFSFAAHPWFVVNSRGSLSRWEVLFRKTERGTRWGHLYKNAFAPFEGIEIIPYTKRYLWHAKLLGMIEGDAARRVGEFIRSSPTAYPYGKKYFLTGPNSNTYAQWVLDHVPEFSAKLSWNAFGKNFRIPPSRLPTR